MQIGGILNIKDGNQSLNFLAIWSASDEITQGQTFNLSVQEPSLSIGLKRAKEEFTIASVGGDPDKNEIFNRASLKISKVNQGKINGILTAYFDKTVVIPYQEGAVILLGVIPEGAKENGNIKITCKVKNCQVPQI